MLTTRSAEKCRLRAIGGLLPPGEGPRPSCRQPDSHRVGNDDIKGPPSSQSSARAVTWARWRAPGIHPRRRRRIDETILRNSAGSKPPPGPVCLPDGVSRLPIPRRCSTFPRMPDTRPGQQGRDPDRVPVTDHGTAAQPSRISAFRSATLRRSPPPPLDENVMPKPSGKQASGDRSPHGELGDQPRVVPPRSGPTPPGVRRRRALRRAGVIRGFEGSHLRDHHGAQDSAVHASSFAHKTGRCAMG